MFHTVWPRGKNENQLKDCHGNYVQKVCVDKVKSVVFCCLIQGKLLKVDRPVIDSGWNQIIHLLIVSFLTQLYEICCPLSITLCQSANSADDFNFKKTT